MEFIKAKPIWPQGCENEKNVMAGFKVKTDLQGEITLRIASPCPFRVFADGMLVGSNTKAADKESIFEIDIELHGENSVIAIDALGGETLPNYVCAEAVKDGEIVFASGYDFKGVILYGQKNGADIWKLKREEKQWQEDDEMFDSTQLTDVKPELIYIKKLEPLKNIFAGVFKESGMLESLLADETTGTDVPKDTEEYYKARKIKIEDINSEGEIIVREGGYALAELNSCVTGHIFTELVANKDSKVNIAVATSREEALSPAKEGTVTAFELQESINTFKIASFNVYKIKYAAVAVTSGELIIKKISVLSV